MKPNKDLVLCAARLFQATLREQVWRKYALDLRRLVGEYLHARMSQRFRLALEKVHAIHKLNKVINTFNQSQVQRIRKEKKKNGSVQGKAQGDASRPSRGDRGR